MVGGFEFSKPTFTNDRVQGKTFNRDTRSIYLQNNFRYSDKHKVVTGFRSINMEVIMSSVQGLHIYSKYQKK